MTPKRPQPGDFDPLFGFAQGAFAGETLVVGWQALETRRLEVANPIPTATDLIMRQLVELGTNSNHDRWLRKFRNEAAWLPMHEQEITIGLRTLPIEVEIVASSPGSGVRAVMDVLESVDTYITEARAGDAALKSDSVLISPSDSEPIPDRLRNNFDAKAEIAGFLLGLNWFDMFDWFPRKRSPEKPNANYDALKLKVVDQLGNGNIVKDRQLIDAWKRASTSQARRLKYWNNQVVKLNSHEFEEETRETFAKATKRYDQKRRDERARQVKIKAERKTAA